MPHHGQASNTRQQFNVVIIDGKQFPDMPRGPTPAPVPGLASSRPKLQAHVLLGNHPQAVKMASCVQMDYRSLYLTYWALGEFEGARHMPDEQAAPTFPPPGELCCGAWLTMTDALADFGMCVKVWSFGPE